MKSGLTAAVIALLVVGLGFFAGVSSYNGLVRADEAVGQRWADVETQYQRRADLIPNLVNTVRGAADFEQETLTAVTEARARATGVTLSADDLNDPAQMDAFMAAQQQLSGALGRLLVVSENYPELRATESFRDFQAQLEGTENRINVARRDYNDTVASFNSKVRQFPGSIIASMTGFDRKTPFEADKGAEDAPTVDFN